MSTTWREELAWAAGFFDGEGCFCNVNRVGKSISIQATVAQIHKEPLERFQKAVNNIGIIGGPYAYKTRVNNKPFYHWSVNGWKNVQAVAALLWEFLGPIKRQQYKTKITEVKSKRKPHSSVSKRATTHCKHGHAFDEDNTYVDTKNHRRCRKCHVLTERTRRIKMKETINGI